MDDLLLMQNVVNTQQGVRSMSPSERGPVTEEILESVSRELESDPLDLPPIYQAIDPEALEDAIASSESNTLRVAFQYAGCEVLVTGCGSVTVEA